MAKDNKKKKKRSYKTLIIVLLMASVFIPATFFAVMKVIEIRSSAKPTEEPKNIEITNIMDTSVSISWITPNKKTLAYVKYGKDKSVKNTAFDKRDGKKGEGEYSIHYVELLDLVPNTKYYYSIVVGSKEYKKSKDEYYTFTTGPILETIQTPLPVKGAVNDPSGDDEEVVIYVYAQNEGKTSNKISVLTTNKRYTLDLSNLRLADLSGYFTNVDGATLYILGQGGGRGEGSVQTEVLQLTD